VKYTALESAVACGADLSAQYAALTVVRGADSCAATLAGLAAPGSYLMGESLCDVNHPL